MALKIKLAMPSGKYPWTMLALRVALVGVGVASVLMVGVCSFYYLKYEGIVDERLKQPLFAQTAKILRRPARCGRGRNLGLG